MTIPAAADTLGGEGAKYFHLSAFTSTVKASFTQGGGGATFVGDVAYDGTDTIGSEDVVGGKIIKYSTFSSTIKNSIAANGGASVAGVEWSASDSNLYQANQTPAPDKLYKNSGFTTTILSSFTAGNVSEHGIDWDGTDTYNTENTNDKCRQFTGFTSTIKASFVNAGAVVAGCSWSVDLTDFHAVYFTSTKYVRHSGFSATVLTSFARGASCRGVHRVDAAAVAEPDTPSILALTGIGM